MLIRVFFFIALLTIIDLYVFSGITFLCRNLNPSTSQIIYFIFWAIYALCIAVMITGIFYSWDFWPKRIRTYSFAFIFVTYFSKLFMILFLIMDDLFRLVRYAGDAIGLSKPAFALGAHSEAVQGGITRSNFLVKAGVMVAAVPFMALLIGMIKGKYEYQIKKVRLSLKKLPSSFENFRIVQISDLHTGSFMDSSPLERVAGMINDLKPDVIFFTGDLVNNIHEEVAPYQHILSKLNATHGVFSILGNHDYGDYHRWSSREEKSANLQRLIHTHREMGWDILLDEHRHIERNGQRISVIGVQNWSARGNFSRYGDLNKAVHELDYSPVNILLSHDPSHWRAEVAGLKKNIDLTLSGHTHGFQFGIDIPGFKWSPVKYMYKEWVDLYESEEQYLYVNRGLGFLGYPGRVGILPEITLLELTNGKATQATS